MRVFVNGVEQETKAATLCELVSELGYGDAKVATAIDGAFVPATARSGAGLREGARIEIVSPRQGG